MKYNCCCVLYMCTSVFKKKNSCILCIEISIQLMNK